MYTERLLPHDAEAEEAVVGSLLIDGEAITAVTSFLDVSDFYIARNRDCFAACQALFDRGEAINQISVAHELSLGDRLETVGGNSYLSHLVMSVPTSVHIEHYGRIVQRDSTMRQLIAAAGDIASLGYEGTSDIDETLRHAEETLFKVRSGRGTRDFAHIRQILDKYMEDSASVLAPGEQILAPIPTGFESLDELLGGGLQRSDLIILAARPSLGKSTMAINVARHAASEGAVVGIFSLEMGAEQIGLRLVSSEASINSYNLRIGHYGEIEYRRILDAIGTLSDLPIYIDETPFQGVVEMRGKARRLQAERGLDLLIVDYLQLIGGTRRNENRVQEMSEISRSMKAIARDLDVPVLACSQLSRAPEQRPSHRPILSDLRESGSIEQDADIVSFIYREDRYTTKEQWEKTYPTEPYPENIAMIDVAKHRNGPIGHVYLYCRNDMARFESLKRPIPSREFA